MARPSIPASGAVTVAGGAFTTGSGVEKKKPAMMMATSPTTSMTVSQFWVRLPASMPMMLMAVSTITRPAA